MTTVKEAYENINFEIEYQHYFSSLSFKSNNWSKPLKCPFHKDSKPSFGVNRKSGAYKCFSCGKGNFRDFIMLYDNLTKSQADKKLLELAGLNGSKPKPLGEPPEKKKSDHTLYHIKKFVGHRFTSLNFRGKVTAIYDYKNIKGKLVYRVVRIEPKAFRPFYPKPDEKNHWFMGMPPDGKRILYRLPELIDSRSGIAFIAEGEKDVDNLRKLGVTATTCQGGAKQWKKEYDYSQYFKGKSIVIFADNDPAGKGYSDAIIRDLRRVAKSITFLDLSRFSRKKGYDISDWIDEGGHTEGKPLIRLVRKLGVDIPTANKLAEGKASDTGRAFPKNIMAGFAGTFAEAHSQYLESPQEFFYFAALTCLGSLLANRVTLQIATQPQPRLFTLLLGESAVSRKSTAIDMCVDFFKKNLAAIAKKYKSNLDFNICFGVGSAEGLLRTLSDTSNILLCLDEFRQLVSKSKIKGSNLLPCVNSLFSKNSYDNALKDSKKSFHVENAYLSMLAASTTDTYKNTYSSEFRDIGFNNRIWIVPADTDNQFSLPKMIPASVTKKLKIKLSRIVKLIIDEPCVALPVEDEAFKLFDHWYKNERNTESEHSRRLDTFAQRLMPLLAINEAKIRVDVDIVEKVIKLINWQFEMRRLYDPIDADNKQAWLEQSIRRHLKNNPLTDRELKRACNYHRHGQDFMRGLRRLEEEQEIIFDNTTQKWVLNTEKLID